MPQWFYLLHASSQHQATYYVSPLSSPTEGVLLVALRSLPCFSDKCRSDTLSQAMSTRSLGAGHTRAILSPWRHGHCPWAALTANTGIPAGAGWALHSFRPAFRTLSPQCTHTRHGSFTFLHLAHLQGARGRASILRGLGQKLVGMFTIHDVTCLGEGVPHPLSL